MPDEKGARTWTELGHERDREARENAPSKKRLAWKLLKASRNPLYVHLRYGYPLDVLEEALKKIPPDKPAAATGRDGGARARESEPSRENDPTENGD